MKAIIYETGEYANNKKDAIRKATDYLNFHPEAKDVCVLRADDYTEIWFIVGRENTENISNWVKMGAY